MILKGLAAEVFYFIMMIPMVIIRFALPITVTVLLIIFLVKGIKYFNKKNKE